MRRIAIPLLLALMLLLVAQNAFALGDTEKEILALVAMPLAVAAVADISGVPLEELASVVATLNNALVPPAQVVEVLRYVPVALVDNTIEPGFDEWLATQLDQGNRGTQLVTVVERRFVEYGVPRVEPITLVQPTVVTRETVFFPLPVRERVIARISHPHGGPPGQLKKQAGVQTGAQIVHEVESAAQEVRRQEKRARKEARKREARIDGRRAVPMISSGTDDVRPGRERLDGDDGRKDKVKVKVKVRHDDGHPGKAKGKHDGDGDRGQGGGKDKSGGQGKGKGKG